MGAHALGAAAYAAKAVSLNAPDELDDEIEWQVARMTGDIRAALRLLPELGQNSSGPLAAGGLLERGVLGTTIRSLQSRVAAAAGGIASADRGLESDASVGSRDADDTGRARS